MARGLSLLRRLFYLSSVNDDLADLEESFRNHSAPVPSALTPPADRLIQSSRHQECYSSIAQFALTSPLAGMKGQ
jgi:hypothetical protein